MFSLYVIVSKQWRKLKLTVKATEKRNGLEQKRNENNAIQEKLKPNCPVTTLKTRNKSFSGNTGRCILYACVATYFRHMVKKTNYY